MRKKVYAIILFILVVTYEIVLGKETNKSTLNKVNKKHSSDKEKSSIERLKRSLDNEEDKPFWANRGKKKLDRFIYDDDVEKTTKVQKRSDNLEKEPFWGARGRRRSESSDNYEFDLDNPIDQPDCLNCYGTIYYKDRRDDGLMPFWGNRGRRSNEVDDDEPFWGTRGKRQSKQDNSDPFWGSRGRRTDTSFWSARGRREVEPFWGSRGRRNDEPFWGSRGRRDETDPFWGSRGRRQDQPFWSSRGRQEDEPFWGNRGRRETEPFWGSQGRKKEDLKESIMKAINLVEDDIDHLSRLRRGDSNFFWSNRGRDSQLKNVFGASNRSRYVPQKISREFVADLKAEPGTVHDSRIYAEEPHYIVVERSSRSSGESEDPFYISRGKKYYFNYGLIKAARDRRGAIEEIVKTVRNDPYYIARGKKDVDTSTDIKAYSTSDEEFLKVKELICSAIDMVNTQQQKGKIKREVDNDRDRRSMLKKLAAQLQNDPFYVSRGKKNVNVSDKNHLLEFINEVAEKCD